MPVTEAERKKINQALGRSLSEWMPLLLLSSLLLARGTIHINLRSFLLGLEMERRKNGFEKSSGPGYTATRSWVFLKT